jgi:aryl-alcohol dehydrogenase-like predicted oxidoreductase
MRYFDHLGRKLSVIAMGCDHFDEHIMKETALTELDYYVDQGGNVIDTAHSYSQSRVGEMSKSEKCIGTWIQKNGLRKELFIATKGCSPPIDDYHQSRIDLKSIKSDIEQSVESLGTPADIWFFHRDNPSMPADEIIDMAIEEVREKGYALHLGASNWTTKRIDEANAWAKAHGKEGFVMSEIQMSLASCTPEQWGDDTIVTMNEEEASWYKEHKMPVMAFSSQAKGYFSNIIAGKELSLKALQRFDTPENRKRAEKVRILSKELAVPPSSIVIAYLTSLDMRVVPIIGSSKPEQIADTLSHADLTLDGDQIDFLLA